jgi:type IV pilus assembly protein PilA
MQREHSGARGARLEQDGFTLLELMMVILIIAILIAVLIPVFLGATNRAKDRAVQTSLASALKGAKSSYLDQQDYSQVTLAALTQNTGGLTFVPAGTNPSSASTVSVLQAPAGNTQQVILAGQSKSGTCFYVLDDESASALYAKLPIAGGCAATGAPIPGAAAWQPSW